MSTTQDELHELERRFAEAEISSDVVMLDDRATDDFRLVGPAGYVLDKQQWLERYRQRQLVTHSLRFTDSITRVYASTAVTIGRHGQRAEYRGHAANGEFRATQIAAHDGNRWRLAGLHLSPIAGRPPFAAPTAEESKR
jgi:hypothetical protein